MLSMPVRQNIARFVSVYLGGGTTADTAVGSFANNTATGEPVCYLQEGGQARTRRR